MQVSPLLQLLQWPQRVYRVVFRSVKVAISLVSPDLPLTPPVPAEVCLLSLLLLCALYDCVFFSRAILSQPRVQLTPAQRKLLSVKGGLGEWYSSWQWM